MKTLITIVLISSISSTIYASENEDAKQVANTWFLSLMKGEIAVTSALSKTPFSFDSKKIIDSDKQLKELYERIVEDKGKRDIKPTSVEVDKIKDEQKLRKLKAPKNSITVHIKIGEEIIHVFVEPGETTKVVGFSD